jgi:hypothetical protein
MLRASIPTMPTMTAAANTTLRMMMAVTLGLRFNVNLRASLEMVGPPGKTSVG